MTVSLVLPWPPSTNMLWRRVGSRTVLSKAGRTYKASVHGAVLEQLGIRKTIQEAVSIRIALHPPDRRRRDIDNTLKAVLDAITWSAVWDDDSQVRELHAVMLEPVRGGRCQVEVRTL